MILVGSVDEGEGSFEQNRDNLQFFSVFRKRYVLERISLECGALNLLIRALQPSIGSGILQQVSPIEPTLHAN